MTKNRTGPIFDPDEARAMLEKYRERMREQVKGLGEVEALMEPNESIIIGPRTELEYRRMLRDIKESCDDDDDET